MSTKQLARTVLDGKRLRFRVPADNLHHPFLEGYLCGMDDFHWMIVTPEGHTHLIHKGSASVITIGDEPAYADEDRHDELEKLVGPFRTWVEQAIFGRDPQPAREAAS